MRKLHLIAGDKRNDSTFVKTGIEMLYKNEEEKLLKRSVRGTRSSTRKGKNGPINYVAKSPLTPEKVVVLKKLYNERIRSHVVDSDEFTKRLSTGYFNTLLSNAIGNISKKKNSNTLLEADILLR